MADFYKGDEIKFAINIEAQGFSMDDDDFDIEVASTRVSIKASKGDTASSSSDDDNVPLVIFKEVPETSSDSSSADSSSSEEESQGEGQWYAIVDTSTLSTGSIRVISTAYVPDANANDGIRRQIAVATLCNLKNA